jgi:hypothetical protein
MADVTPLKFGNHNRFAARARDLYEDRRPCTIDGRPATVSGFALPFGYVRSLDGKFTSEWAWETIVRIMERDGKFTL